MSTIVTRAGKGSALTHNEVDANFNNLNNDKIEAAQSVTLTNKTISGANNTLSNIGNSSLTNSSVTIGSTSVSLGSTATTVSGLTLSSPTVSGGTINNASVGATTASTGAFTTLSASSTVSGTGFSDYLASPPAIGGTAAAAGSFTSLTDSGNLTFTGTGNRITGDFSNATAANRVMFQNSVTNGRTNISALPNGTSTTAGIDLYGSSSDPANTSLFRIANTNAEYQFEGTRTGTGTYLPMTFYTGGSERMRVDTSGRVLIGRTGSFTGSETFVSNGFGSFGSDSAPQVLIGNTGSGAGVLGTFNNYGVEFRTNNTERMRIDSSGNVGIGTSSPSSGSIVRFLQVDNATSSGLVLNAVRKYSIYSSSSGTLSFLDETAGAEQMRIDASGYTQFSRNLVMPYQGAPTSKAAAATLTGAELVTGILNTTGTTYTITLPTGTNIEGALTWAGNNVCLDFFVINTASGTITIGANGNTTLGGLTIATGTSAHFRIRRTAANTFTVYRL